MKALAYIRFMNLLRAFRLVSNIECYSMEKRKPHYDLDLVKALTNSGRCTFSSAALAGASALGLDETAIVRIIANLQPKDFHISKMASSQAKIWLDLYRPMTAAGQIYLKIKATDDVFIVSFIPKSATLSAGA